MKKLVCRSNPRAPRLFFSPRLLAVSLMVGERRHLFTMWIARRWNGDRLTHTSWLEGD